MQLSRAWERAVDAARDPVAWTTATQVVKTAAAGVLAWYLAAEVFSLPQPFLASWSALLIVHSTLNASIRDGLKQMVAAVLGVVLAWATWHVLGFDVLSLGVMLLLALAVGQVGWLREESRTAAATALFVLTTGFGDESPALLARLLDTGIGLGVGVAINFLVWPPLLDMTAARAIETVRDKIADLLAVIASECHDQCTNEHVETWIERSRQLDEDIDQAWALVRQGRDSGRFNPRRGAADVRQSRQFGELLDSAEQSLSEIRSIARTLGHSVNQTNAWENDFRERWTRLLDQTASGIHETDAQALSEVRRQLSALADDFSDEDLSARHWPEYGGLILNLRNIATAMDEVAPVHPAAGSRRRPLHTPAL